MKRKLLFALIALMVVGSMRAEALVQSAVGTESSGRITGVIVDLQDARVVDASILIEGKTLRRELRSNELGEFTVDLPKGMYRVKASHPNFKTRVIKRVRVADVNTSIVKIMLQIKMTRASGGKCPKGSLCL